MMYANQDVSEPDRGCGARLRKAREAAGLRLEDVAAQLKMPVRVVESLENEDWDRLGAPVFVRGQLRSYSRLVGLATSTTLQASGVAPIEPSKLVSRSYTPRMQRLMEQGTRRLIYIVITAAIAVPVWLATKPHLAISPATVQPLDVPANEANALGATTTTNRRLRKRRKRRSWLRSRRWPLVLRQCPPSRCACQRTAGCR